MKHYIWIIIIAFFSLNACKKHNGYTIKGELKGADGLKIVLYKITPDSIPLKIDSCIIEKGKFEMKGWVEFPEYCAIYAGDNGPLLLFVENREIKIVFNLKDMQKSKVTGSKENDLFVEFNNKMAEFKKITAIQSQLDINDSIQQIHDNNDSIQLQHVNIEPVPLQYIDSDSIRLLQIEYMKLFVEKNPNRIVTAFVVDRELSYYLQSEELEIYINSFDKVNSKSSWVQSIVKKHEIAKSIEPGQPFVDLKMRTPDDNEIAISDFIGKEKYVLIYFWASWCGESRKENPEMEKLYNKYKDNELEIIGVSLDKNKKDWTKAIESDELTWIQMSDLGYLQSEGARLYSAFSLPYTVLLDKEGKIHTKGIKIDELELVISD